MISTDGGDAPWRDGGGGFSASTQASSARCSSAEASSRRAGRRQAAHALANLLLRPLLILILALVGLVLGIVALRRQDRRRTFGAIGLGLNAFILIGTVGLAFLGTFFRHSNS